MEMHLILIYLQLVKLQNTTEFHLTWPKTLTSKSKEIYTAYYIYRTNNYLWFGIYTATANDYANKNIKIKTCLIQLLNDCTNLIRKQGQLDRFSYKYFQQSIQ